MKNQKGFSLVELLVVVIIIAIIAAIAIPSLLASRRAANEASAINSLRTIHSANATYQATLGNNTNYAATLLLLSQAAGGNLIDPALGAATAAATAKSGYVFSMAGGSQVYCSSASPAVQGTSGVRGFAASERGTIYQFADGATAIAACDTVTFDATGGTAVQ